MRPDPSIIKGDVMYCLTCGYPLKELKSEQCPECGRPFSKWNARSYGTRPAQWYRWYRAARPYWWVWIWLFGILATFLLVLVFGQYIIDGVYQEPGHPYAPWE